MKKSAKKFLAILSTVALLIVGFASSLVIANAEAEVLNGLVPAFNGEHTQAFVPGQMNVSVATGSLSPVFDGGYYQFTTTEAIKGNRPNAQLGNVTQVASYSGYSAVALYASLPTSDNSLKMQMQFAFGNTGIDLYSIANIGAPYYLLDSNGLSVQTISGNDYFKAVTVPGGFEGYIILPFSSMANFSAHPNMVNFFNIWVEENGAAATMGSFKLSQPMLTTLPTNSAEVPEKVLLAGDSEPTYLFAPVEKAPLAVKVPAFNGEHTGAFVPDVMNVTNATGALSPVLNDGYYKVSTNDGILTTTANMQLGMVSNVISRSGYDAVAVYVSVPASENTISMQWQFAFGNTGIDQYAIANLGAVYYKLEKDGFSTDVISGNDYFKAVSVKGGFEGYVVIPFISMPDVSAHANMVNFFNVWVSEAGTATVGGFNMSAPLLVKLPANMKSYNGQAILDGAAEPTYLFTADVPVAKAPIEMKVPAFDGADTGSFVTDRMLVTTVAGAQTPVLNGGYYQFNMTDAVLAEANNSAQLGKTSNVFSYSGYDAVAVYVSVPASKNTISMQWQFAFGNTGIDAYGIANLGSTYYKMDKDGVSAAIITGDDYFKAVSLQGGFEGYVVIPFASLPVNFGAYPNMINFFNVWMRESGAATVGTFNMSCPMLVKLPENMKSYNAQALIDGNTVDMFAAKAAVSNLGAQVREKGIDENTQALRFGFTLDATGINYANADPAANGDYSRKLDENSKVVVNGETYTVKDFGAVLSLKNNSALTLDSVDNNKTIKIVAEKLYAVEADAVTYTTIVNNVPVDKADMLIYARSYVTYTDGEQDITIYGDTIARCLNNAQ